MAIVTLLTDFGLRDEYVGVIKAVVLSIHPGASIVDISHEMAPQDVVGAAHVLKAAFSWFPQGTVHVAVVDPGVGTQRAILAARCDGHLFLAPDNGLLAPILMSGSSVSVYTVENQTLFKHPVSRTFHGRDIFAPVAARLAMGLPLTSVGPSIAADRIQSLGDLGPRIVGRAEIEGRIVSVDRFGNLISNVHKRDLSALEGNRISVTIGDYRIQGLVENYTQQPGHGPVAIIGSRDCIEIAVGGGNAAESLRMGIGQTVRVCLGAEEGSRIT